MGTRTLFFEPRSLLFPCFSLPFPLLFWARPGPSSSQQVVLGCLHADSVDFNLLMFPFRQFPTASSRVLHSAEYSVGTQQILNNHHSSLKGRKKKKERKQPLLNSACQNRAICVRVFTPPVSNLIMWRSILFCGSTAHTV